MNAPLPEDTPSWVLACVALWLLGSLWMGWRRGVIRQFTTTVAWVAGIAAGLLFGKAVAPMVPPLGFPVFVRPIVAGVLLGVAVWLVLRVFCAILFKKTSDQTFAPIRVGYGLMGALLGVVHGVLVLALAAWGVRLAGSFSEGVRKSSAARVRSGAPAIADSKILSFKQALDHSPLSQWLTRMDPVPREMYTRLEKAGQILTSPEAMERLLLNPDFISITRHPKVIALREDPEVQASLHSGDLLGLLRHPKVRLALNDTQLQTTLQLLSWEKHVDQALITPASPILPPSSKPRPSR